jgi:hypothetical protein
MTYPQPSGASYVLNNQSAFRLTTTILGPGDIYESDASGLALAVGPLSDIANIGVTYLDEQRVPALVNDLVISTERSYIGRVDARMDTVYPFTLRPGRVLFTIEDLYDPAFRPTGFGVNDVIEYLDPVLDVVEYFTPAPSVVPARADKELYLRYLDAPGVGGTSWLMVPAWGRKYGHISFFNANTVTANTVSVIGVRFSMTEFPSSHYQETLLAAAAMGAGTTRELVWNAAAQGVFDMIGISATSAGPLDVRITLSDKPAGA